MSKLKSSCQLILALDLPSLDNAKDILSKTGPQLQWVKIGLQLFTLYGPDIVKIIADLGYNIFLDLKLHDIPNTVASAVKSLKNLPVGMLTLHTSGGPEMMKWANDARQEINHAMQLLGVTVLTSMDQPTLHSIGVQSSPQEQVQRLAQLAIDSGLQGLVCSPLELPALRKSLGNAPSLVTPGIRPLGSDANEQKRIMTPSEAASLGASHIVVGRPIYNSKNPAQTIHNILEEINSVKISHA